MTLFVVSHNECTVLPGPQAGGRSPTEKMCWIYLKQFKKFRPLSENSSLPLVSQAGYGPMHYICWHRLTIQMSWLVCIQWIYLIWVCSQ